MRLPLRLPVALFGAWLTAACSDTPAGPTTTPPPVFDPPRISCPASQTTQSADGQPVMVSYSAPTIVGGAPPTATACAPLSGSRFPIGPSAVACTVVDAQQRSDTCSFTVTVQAPAPPAPRLSATKFMAFGDSITEGKVGSASVSPRALFGCPGVPQPTQYAGKLLSKLSLSYPSQAPLFAVVNCGYGGEAAAAGKDRLPSALAINAPQVLLLMEGANDLLQNQSVSAVATLGNDLATMVRFARSNGVTVFLGTLLPERATACGCGVTFRGGAAALIQPANDRIRSVAATEGAIVVDLYSAFGGTADAALIDLDGLHPTPLGHDRIADTFFASIKSRLEIAGATPTLTLHP